jgi:PH domain
MMNDTIFTMKGDGGISGIPSISAVPLSYSSADSGADYGSLLGEAIISKDMTCTTIDNDESKDTPIHTLIPICKPLLQDNVTAKSEIANGTKKLSPLLPPLSDGSASPLRAAVKNEMITVEATNSPNVEKSDFLDVIGCPCCQQNWDGPTGNTLPPILIDPLDDTTTPTNGESGVLLPKIRSLSLFTAAESDDDDENEVMQLEEDLMTGVLKEGVNFRITQIVVEGWLHKKGTGHDWMGSRGWKARWARLGVGYIDGYGDVEVPLLGISWFQTSATNSTVIVLDSTVVLAVDLPHKDKPHRFEIRHASSRMNSSLPVTRTFTAASRKARDAWVYAISQALLSYEKEKAAIRKLSPTNKTMQYSPPQHSTASNVQKTRDFDDIWLQDRFPPIENLSFRSATNNGHSEKQLSSISQPKLRRNISSPPRPSLRSSIQPVTIIGQQGISIAKVQTVNESSRNKPFVLHARSTSV